MDRINIEGIRFGSETDLPEELRGGLPLDELNRFFETLASESDRGLVLTIGSILDAQCGEWLTSIFSQGNADSRKGAMRSFGSFASRINGLHALGLLSDAAAKDLHAIRALRNDAAHGWAKFELDEQVAKDRIDPLASGIKTVHHAEGQATLHPRAKLMFSGAALLFSLSMRNGKAPAFAKLEMMSPATSTVRPEAE